jgi:hypothetical protein
VCKWDKHFDPALDAAHRKVQSVASMKYSVTSGHSHAGGAIDLPSTVVEREEEARYK